jgi:hypothetical protein
MIKHFRERIHLIRLHKSDALKDKEIELLGNLSQLLHKKGDARFDKLINACLYSALVNRDLYYLAEDFYFQKNKNRKNFVGRLFCMTLIEFLDDINFLLGKELTNELAQNNMLSYTIYITELNKHYSKIKREYGKVFREIRNQVAAHRSKDAQLLLEHINKVPMEQLTKIGQEISKGEIYFNTITNLIIEYLGKQKIGETKQTQTYNLMPGAVKGGDWKDILPDIKDSNSINTPPNTAVFTTKFVIEDKKTITSIKHEEEDGAWMFFSNEEVDGNMENFRLVSLGKIIMLDPTIIDLMDMSVGYIATRRDENDPWNIKQE